MNRKLPVLSAEIGPVVTEILEIVNTVTRSNGIPFFIVGAFARDIFFTSRRATNDLDIGIQIGTWDTFDTVKEALIATGKFTSTDISHRLHFFKERYPLDMLPFGSVTEPDGSITWPDKRRMRILGFDDAYEDSIKVFIKGMDDYPLRVAGPVGLVILKLIAWSDAADRRERDAKDIDLILSEYYSLSDNSERVFDCPEIMDAVAFDIQRAGTILLGKDVAGLIRRKRTEQVIRSIIDAELSSDTCNLAMNMRENFITEDTYEAKYQMITDFKKGFNL
jgi:predicted nucleotidyltransferase